MYRLHVRHPHIWHLRHATELHALTLNAIHLTWDHAAQVAIA